MQNYFILFSYKFIVRHYIFRKFARFQSVTFFTVFNFNLKHIYTI